MIKATDKVILVAHRGPNIIQMPYEDYILIGQSESEDTPTIHVNADALMLGRALNMLKVQYLNALEQLTVEDLLYVTAQLNADKMKALKAINEQKENSKNGKQN